MKPVRQQSENATSTWSALKISIIAGIILAAFTDLTISAWFFNQQRQMRNQLSKNYELLESITKHGLHLGNYEVEIHQNGQDVYSDMLNSNENALSKFDHSVFLERHKRDDKGRNDRRHKRTRTKSRRRQSENVGLTAFHLKIDSEHSQPNSPHLKTGSEGEIIKYWKEDNKDFNSEQTFATFEDGGVVKIQKSGLYLIYSQITYFDRTGRWSHTVSIGDRTFVKCLASEWGMEVNPETNMLYNTVHQCYTSGVTFLNKDDNVSVKSMYPDRVIHADSTMSFWGLIKLS